MASNTKRQQTTDIQANSLRDYINLFKANITMIVIISLIFLIGTTIYAIIAPDIYTSTVNLKITKPQGNILNNAMPDLQGFAADNGDRFIANEIETIYNSTIVQQVAHTIVDTFRTQNTNKNDFSLILDKNYFDSKNDASLKSIHQISRALVKNVKITQLNNLDFIQIEAKSPSPYESALIANTFAKTYKDFNLAENRKQIKVVEDFLAEQLKEKKKELDSAEDAVKAYQVKAGGVELDQQTSLLVSKLADFEAQQKTVEVDISVAKTTLEQYQQSLKKQDPSVANYLNSKSTEPYLQDLQDKIAKLKTQRDLALSGANSSTVDQSVIDQYNKQINDLNAQLDRSYQAYRSDILATSPEEVKDLTQKAFEQEVKYQSLVAQHNQLTNVLNSYEQQMNRLPARTLDLARLERRRQAAETLFTTLEEKYQEAQLNEQSTAGNVMIMNWANPPDAPSDPNRILIILMGLVGGVIFSFGFVYIKSYFDKTIKTPEDIESKNVNVIAWIPKIKELKSKDSELIVARNPESIQSEAFKTLRTRIQFSPKADNAKVIMLTSSAPGEGKSLITANLGVSFALDHKKTVIVDCDLRKPRVHTIFNDDEAPGYLNYFFGKTSFENIVKKTEVRNLEFISGGSIPPNPSEIIGSPRMKAFFIKLRSEYDIILVDSPPIMAVADSEILSRIADLNLLVVSSDSTEIDWLEESVELLSHDESKFMGVILNNFNYKSGYHAYYKYYGHYAKDDMAGKSYKLRNKE
jgi:polysaccharide biosynthesis transport protein